MAGTRMRAHQAAQALPYPRHSRAGGNPVSFVAQVQTKTGPHRAALSINLPATAAYFTATGMPPRLPEAMRSAHSFGPVLCTEMPLESTATVTGISFTSNS